MSRAYARQVVADEIADELDALRRQSVIVNALAGGDAAADGLDRAESAELVGVALDLRRILERVAALEARVREGASHDG